MRLIIFHYHLLPGGVTQVIISSVTSILKFIPEITEITLVCGKKENTEEILRKIKRSFPDETISPVNIKMEIIPEIGYLSECTDSPESEKIVKILTEKFSDGIWWIHNFQLGKNPFFTKALLAIAEKFPSIQMVMQIHDFPESARYQYIKELKSHIPHSLYPLSANVRYAVINPRDKKFLISAGIPDSMVFLLDNPVEDSRPLSVEPRDNELENYFYKTEQSYLPGQPILIYPVRTIRRKNVLEAGFISKILTEQFNLFVTLPGVSETEKHYSEQVESAFSEKLIHGVFASGIKGESAGIGYYRQIAASRAVLSSSVQEGFGYLFINALQWNKPLIARYLDILDGTENLFTNQNAQFYTGLFVPLSVKEQQLLKEAYNSKITGLSSILSENVLLKLKEQLSGIFHDNLVDFSFLPVEMQISFLKKLSEKSFQHEVRVINSNSLRKIEKLLFTSSRITQKPDLYRFTLKTHAEKIKDILDSFLIPVKIPDKKDINLNLLTTFARIDCLRLLYN